MREGKKIAIVNKSNNKKLIAQAMGINHKNIYIKSQKETKDLKVKEDIQKTFVDNPAYGHRRLALELKMNKKKILRIMHKFGLKPPRLWYQKKFLTRSNLTMENRFTNLLKNLDIGKYRPGQIWSSDITYVKFAGKFMYLIVIKDVISKNIVSFNFADTHNSDLVLKTLKEAFLRTKNFPLIFHSDRGKEYLSEACITFLERAGVKISVSSPGSPWQNGWSESFFSIFKKESGDLNRFENLGELTEYIYGYIDYYNKERIQLELKMSPSQFIQKFSESVLEKRGT